MIRQAINCDMCGAERVESTSFWFVADELGGEIRLRGWESPKKSGKNVRHLCGQKCVQRMMDNFTASLKAGQQAGKVAKEPAPKTAPQTAHQTAGPEQADTRDSDDERPLLERMGYDRETAAFIEADSWAGPARPKDALRPAEKGFIHATRIKPQAPRPFQRMA
ncbi:hypothetical protein [Edaphobacter aggregans]|uniref:hypothetical protein n=1 Tax=Edaphobacter aggregans TaxID=570835 RepID=UPI000556A396|nr:hypothetical protein [Edaphobacter aggregans]